MLILAIRPVILKHHGQLISIIFSKVASVSHYIRQFKETKKRCANLSISDMDLPDICLKGLRSSIRDRIDGSDFLLIAQVQVRALIVELRMTKEKNDSDLSNNSAITTAEPNNLYSESVTLKESSIAAQEHIKQKKTATLDFSKAEGVVQFSSDYRIIGR